MTRFTPLPPLFALIAAILIADGGTAPSWPCGGFFCAAVPMNQVAERILFAADGSTIGMQVVEVASAAKGGTYEPRSSEPTMPRASLGRPRGERSRGGRRGVHRPPGSGHTGYEAGREAGRKSGRESQAAGAAVVYQVTRSRVGSRQLARPSRKRLLISS